MNWFLYDRDLLHERVNEQYSDHIETSELTFIASLIGCFLHDGKINTPENFDTNNDPSYDISMADPAVTNMSKDHHKSTRI